MSSNLGKTEKIDKEQKPGALSIVSLSVQEREMFLDYMDKVNPNLNASYIFALLGDDTFLKFFDVMAGRTIKVPSRDSIMKVINYIKVYRYCNSRGCTSETYEKAAKIFDRRVVSVERVVAKVDKILNGANNE